MHFTIQLAVRDQLTSFHFEPSSVSEYDNGYRILAEHKPQSVEFRMTKDVDGEWRITTMDVPEWVREHETELVAAIREREYPQDV